MVVQVLGWIGVVVMVPVGSVVGYWACFNHLPDVGIDTRPVNTLSGSELAFGDA